MIFDELGRNYLL